jgi:hypothetical protein
MSRGVRPVAFVVSSVTAVILPYPGEPDDEGV